MNRASIAALVEDERVHRDLYLSEALFALEQKHFFANTWNYVGHASQVPNAGDFVALDLAGRPIVMVRGDDDAVRVLYNRCAHKGTPLVSARSGNTGRFFRCPYHAWTYRLDGTRAPCRSPTATREAASTRRPRARACEDRPASLCTATSSSHASIPAAPTSRATSARRSRRSTTWSTARRSAGCRIEGGCLRTLIRCNWKT